MGTFAFRWQRYRSIVLTALLAGLVASLVIVSASLRSEPAPVARAEPLRALRLPVLDGSLLQWRILSGHWSSEFTAMSPPARQPRVTQRLLEQYRQAGRVYRERAVGYQPRAIVIHGTGSGEPGSGFATLGELHRYFSRPGAQASAHFAIDRSGRIMQLVPLDQAAFHVATRGWNEISIGIELLNDNSGTEPFSRAQLRAASDLTRTLGTQFGIPVEGVVRHRTIQPVDRTDPAGNFPWRKWVGSLGASTSN